MEWLDLIESRHTAFAWEEENVPSKDLILEALQEVYQHIPSKNLQFPYHVRLYRNNNTEVRKKIMTICQRNTHQAVEDDKGNPQVLAPWLLGFNARWVSDLEKRYEYESVRGFYNGLGQGQKRTNDTNGGQTQTENIEIGIFSAYIMLALANKGIQSGMCQNICRDFDYASKIFQTEDDERSLDFRFIMGVGYGKDINTWHKYYDPRVDREKEIPFPPSKVERVYPRPEIRDVIKVIDNDEET